MHEFLGRIVEAKRREVERLRTTVLEQPGVAEPVEHRAFATALRGPELAVIGEIKRRSPSKGDLRRGLDPGVLARTYERHGARAVSVLTDGQFFGGSGGDLLAARGATSLPVLRKDFILDECQLLESARLGADAVLLIARILGPRRLAELERRCRELELEALVEVHDADEIGWAVDAGAEVIGVNNRDLDTFQVDPETAIRLRPRIPEPCVAVAESGVRDPEVARRFRAAGYDAILVGELLMLAADPGAALLRLRQEGSA